MTFSRIIKFVKQYLLSHPWYVVVYSAAYFLKDFKFNTHFYNTKEITRLLREGKSLIRVGDGEINLLLDLKNHYHFYSPKLKMMIREVITSYSPKSSYILSVPRFINFSNAELKAIGKLNVWMPFKVMFLLIFPKKVSYMDAHNFYYDDYFEEAIAPIFKDKTVILVTKKETIEKQRNNPHIPWENIRYIEAPEQNALDFYEAIKKAVNRELVGYLPKNIVLFVAMGPAGKYLIFEYAKRGYQAIDIGKVSEVMFTKRSIQYLI